MALPVALPVALPHLLAPCQDRYCSWVTSAHKTFDEELWFDDPITVHNQHDKESLSQHLSQAREAAAGNESRNIIEYRALFVGGTR